MGITVVKNELGKFKKKLYATKVQFIIDKAFELIEKKALETAQMFWDNTYKYLGKGKIDIRAERENGILHIIAEGTQVSYIEYGFGVEGIGTYKGELPTTGVPITGAWEYYYPSEKKDEIRGVKGWWLTEKIFIKGQEAQMPMYNTSKVMQDYLKNDFKRELKEKLNAII